MSPSRPNVLFVITDQHHADALGVGNSSYHTPNIDRLAESGTRFTRCYATHPQCSPSRSSLVTGLLPHQTGVHALADWGPFDLDPDSHSVGRVLREAGYRTGWFGRWDLGTDNAEPLGWGTHDLDVNDLDVTGSPGRDGAVRDEETLADAISFLREGGDESPFFLTASFNLPHRPYYEEEGFADTYSRSEVPVPASFHDDLRDKPRLQAEWAPGDVPAEYDDLTEEQFQELGYRYRTMVSRADEHVGALLDALEEEGLAENTIVVFTADHGDMQGGHGMVGKHTVPYEEVLRVPLIVRRLDDAWPATVDDLVSNAALPGTLIELAGLEVPAAFEGGSVSEAMDVPPDRQQVFFEHKIATGEHHPYRGIRTRDWKYVEYLAEDASELYDLQNDPWEHRNLASRAEHDDAAEYEEVADDLRAELHRWWETTGGDEEAWTEPIEE